MNFTYFPVREFTEALQQTSKVKARLQPFIGEIESYNMQWTFQIFSQLYKYTHAAGIEVSYKFNALVAIKVLLNTCEFPVLLCTQVYFLPHIRKVATFQIHLPEKQRGLAYFTSLGYSATQENKKYGYNYVRLASEIISLMSRVKPWRLYRDEQVSQPSQFASSLDILKAYQWKEYQVFVFYSEEDEQRLRNRFISKLQNFPLRSHKYYQFFQSYLDRVIRKEYSPKGIDPRKILQSCQIWACEMVLQTLKQILKQRKASVKTNVIRMITDFIRWGYIKAYYIIEQQDVFGDLLEMIRKSYQPNNSHRKGYAFRELQGSQQERKNLHRQLIRCLQIWAVCIPKNPVNLTEQSKSSTIYKQFLLQLKISVPEGNFKKLRDECESNLEKHKLINYLIMKEMQINFDATKLRRTSSNLQQLFKIDPNFLSLSTFKSYITSQFLSQYQNFSQNQNSFSDSEEEDNTESSASKSVAPCILGDIKEKSIFLSPSSLSMANKLTSTKQISSRRKKFQEENYCGEVDEDVETKKISKPYFKMHKNFDLTKTKGAKISNEPKVQFFEGSSFDFDSHTSIILKQTESNDSINIHVSSPIKMKNSTSKKDSSIESTIFQSHIKKLLKRNAQLEQALLLKDIEIQILRAKQNVRNQSTNINTSWNGTNSAPIYRQSQLIPCREQFFKQYIWGMKQLTFKNVFHNKGLLMKNETIQIGFVIQSAGDGSAQLQLYITPEYHLKNINLQIKDPSNILQQWKKNTVQQIPRLKQRKLSFKCKVNNFPYYLPKLYLKYNIGNMDQQHYLLLPLTPNRLISFNGDIKTISPSVRFQTGQFASKYADIYKIQSLFPQFKQLKSTDKINILAGNVKIFDSNYNIYIKIDKTKVYLQGQYEVNKQYKERRQQLQFLLVSLLQILSK